MSSAPVSSPPTIPDYELLRPIGRGSYGDVWLARAVTGTYRAIKIVWRSRFADPEPFEREFRGLREFAEIPAGEPNQLALLHVGRNEPAGFFYYVMELADDASGARRVEPESYVPLTLAELHQRRGRLPPEECVRIGVELAATLAALHARGLVHRDVKPSNIILAGGIPKLADIGLVAPSASARTFIGTEGFVPPEGPGSPAADVFALGKVLYELATGLDRQVFPKLPDDLNQMPDRRALLELNEVLLRACEPAPQKRYRDGAALQADLVTLQSGRPVRRFATWQLVLLATAGIAVAGAAAWTMRQPSPEPPASGLTLTIPPQSVAVLPFVNLSGDKEQDYLSDGVSDQILNSLARERDLRVAGSGSSFSLKGRNLPAAEIGRVLHVAQLVEGSVQRAGGRVRVNVRLTRTADGVTEDLGSFNRDAADLFALEDEIARAVVVRIAHRRVPSGAVLTRNPDAYDAYLRGRTLQMRSPNGAKASIEFYQRAVELDPMFALAWARLAEAMFRPYTAQNDQSAELAQNARAAIEHALAVQPDLPEALIARANWHRNVNGDFAAARADLARAESLQPATAQLRLIQAFLAADAEEWPEALRLVREALQLDPQNGDVTNAAAVVFLVPRGEFAEADRLLAQAMAIQGLGAFIPFQNRVYLRFAWRGPEAALRFVEQAVALQRGRGPLRALLLATLGRTAEARTLVEAAEHDTNPDSPTAALSAEFRENVTLSVLAAVSHDDWARRRAEIVLRLGNAELARNNRAPMVWNRLVLAEAALGHRDEALALLEQWRRQTASRPSAFARIGEFHRKAAPLYAQLGRADEAVALLQESTARGYVGLGLFPRDDLLFVPIAQDPRFKALRRQLDDWAAAQPDPTDEPARKP